MVGIGCLAPFILALIGAGVGHFAGGTSGALWGVGIGFVAGGGIAAYLWYAVERAKEE